LVSARTLATLRQFAVARSLFSTGSIQLALDRMGFVQADPIRAPARAQDLTLRHRVSGYRAGDLERRYPELQVEEDFFINYGFMSSGVQALMHPRTGPAWPAARRKRAEAILAFIGDKGSVHPREVDRHFAHGRVTNYWGGSSSASTHLLEMMHYRGMLRVVGRDGGVRLYGLRPAQDGESAPIQPDARLDALVDVIVHKYAPLPGHSLSMLIRRLRYGTPQWRARVPAALARATKRLAHERVDGVDWYWPAGEDLDTPALEDTVRLLAPFDAIVWDRRRFELFWDWAYRFEAYTPVAKRKLGYYALPLLWRDRVIGWGNVSIADGSLKIEVGYVTGTAPRGALFRRALDEEHERLRAFLAVGREPTGE
jgi:uncharacterized protein